MQGAQCKKVLRRKAEVLVDDGSDAFIVRADVPYRRVATLEVDGVEPTEPPCFGVVSEWRHALGIGGPRPTDRCALAVATAGHRPRLRRAVLWDSYSVTEGVDRMLPVDVDVPVVRPGPKR